MFLPETPRTLTALSMEGFKGEGVLKYPPLCRETIFPRIKDVVFSSLGEEKIHSHFTRTDKYIQLFLSYVFLNLMENCRHNHMGMPQLTICRPPPSVLIQFLCTMCWNEWKINSSIFAIFRFWDVVVFVLKCCPLLMNCECKFDHYSKNKNRKNLKIDHSFDSALCASLE